MQQLNEGSFADRLNGYREEIERRRADPEYQREHNERLARYFRCVKCCDTGQFSVREPDDSYRQVDCDACSDERRLVIANEQIRRRSRYAELPQRFQRATFDSFSHTGDSVLENAWTAAWNYAVRIRSWPWLCLMSEEPGTGKSHLAAAIVNRRIEDYDKPAVKWLSVPRWLNRLRRGFGDGSYDDTLEMALTAPCLVLDDFGAEYHRARTNDADSWAAEQLYLVVNERYENESETIITSNVPIRRFPPRIASRISDVGTKLVKTVLMETVSYRKGV